jgi:hypothetical protein
VYNVPAITGTTGYSWTISPENAGTISGTSQTGNVIWNPGFIGRAAVRLQVSRNEELSEISELIVNIAELTRLLSQPEDTVMCAEQPVNLKVEAEGYNLIYNWYKDGDPLISGPSDEVSIPSALVDDSGNYFCRINGSCGDAVTGNSNLTVLPVTRINYITPDTEVPFGGGTTLEVETEGHDLTYQWYKDDDRLNNGTSSSFILQNVDANDIGLYKTSVSGTCGTWLSSNVYVYVKRDDSSEDPEVYVWPTVIVDKFNIAVSNDKNYNLFITDNNAKLIKEFRNWHYQTVIDLGGMPAGIYIATIYNNSFRKSVKLIKR